MTRRRRAGIHFLLGSTGRNWLRLLLRHRVDAERRCLRRAARISLFTALGTPLRCAEALRFGHRVARQRLDPPPLFILGHWRSGTTNLHNLLLQDPQFGWLSLLQSLAPSCFLSAGAPIGRWLARRLPETRPMDAVPVGIDAPMSEDFAMANLSDLTHYHGYFFPRDAERIFRRTVLFEGVSPRTVRRWRLTYTRLLRKVSLANGGRRLALKNPPNTGRIPALLELFPDAAFVHLVRNPFVVHASTLKMMDRFLRAHSLQRYRMEEVEQQVLRRQRLLLERYLVDRERIPPGRLVELRHEEVEADPRGAVERIYAELDLPGFHVAKPRLERYLAGTADYRKNTYGFDPAMLARVRRELAPLIERWGYAEP